MYLLHDSLVLVIQNLLGHRFLILIHIRQGHFGYCHNHSLSACVVISITTVCVRWNTPNSCLFVVAHSGIVCTHRFETSPRLDSFRFIVRTSYFLQVCTSFCINAFASMLDSPLGTSLIYLIAYVQRYPFKVIFEPIYAYSI